MFFLCYISAKLLYFFCPYQYLSLIIIMLLNLQSTPFFEGQPSIKNAHTANHIRIFQNNIVLVCMDQSIYVYSLLKISRNSASLISIIHLSQIFNNFQKQLYQDFVTSIFRNAEKEDFSSQIFSRSGDTKSNALLKIDSIKDRITFFNNNFIKVIKFELNQLGELLILLADGRGAILQNYESRQVMVNLNEISKQKIKQVCFIKPHGLCIFANYKIIYISDLKDKTKQLTFKINIPNVADLHGSINSKDRAQLCIVTTNQIHVLEIKKKIIVTNVFKFDHFISKTFYFGGIVYVSTLRSLIRIDLSTLQKMIVNSFDTPTELLYVDKLGSFIAKSNSNTKQSLWLVDSTTNGVFVCQTIRRNGNYKQGRLIIFQPQIQYFIKRLIHNIKDNDQFINVKDAVFINMTPQSKALLQQIINLSKSNILIYDGIELTVEQYNALAINITHAFEGKQLVKQKIIERSLKHRFENSLSSSKGLDLRCCFTGKILLDEPLSHCELCDLYGIENEGNKCVVCRNQMIKYE